MEVAFRGPYNPFTQTADRLDLPPLSLPDGGIHRANEVRSSYSDRFECPATDLALERVHIDQDVRHGG